MSELFANSCGIKGWSLCVRIVTMACLLPAMSGLASAGSVTSPPLVDAGASALRVIGALVFVLAVFFVGLWATRNWQRLGLQRGRPMKLRIMESRALGNRQALHIVKYRKQLMLVAASPAGVVLLTELGEEQEDEVPDLPPAINFSNILSQALNRK